MSQQKSKKSSFSSLVSGTATPIIIGLLIIASYLIGSLSTEVKLLKTGSVAGRQTSDDNSTSTTSLGNSQEIAARRSAFAAIVEKYLK